MLIPTGGFGWAVGGHAGASPVTSECLLGIGAADESGVDAFVERPRAAGVPVSGEPAQQPWGYAATFTGPDGRVWSGTSAPLPS